MVINVDQVSFSYPRQRTPALESFSARFRGGITGIVGPNGAGKTTLFRLLLGALRPTGGNIRIDGVDADAFRMSGRLGYIPDRPQFNPHLTVADFLRGLAELSHSELPPAPQIEHLLSARLGELSLGETRRVELQAVLVGTPTLLILDEPTNGLDPAATVALRNDLARLKANDRIILIASHHLDELQRLSDSIAVLRNGKLAGHFAIPEIRAQYGSVEALFSALLTIATGAP